MASRSRQRSSSDGSDAAERLHRGGMTKPESKRNTAASEYRSRCLFDNVAPPVLLSAATWLSIRDLLTLGTVSRSFRDLTTDDLLWKSAAVFLFRSALLDGQDSLVEGVSDSPVGLRKDAPGNLTLQDICRCMVGAWPTHIDRHWRGDELLQASVGGVLQPLQASTGGGGAAGGGGGGGSGADPKSAPQQADTTLPVGLCTGVVFRGGLGGDRAVRANVPFPWAGCGRTRSQPLRGADMSRGSIMKMALTTYDRRINLHYPDVVLARVKAAAPFALLWPGHAAAGKGEGGSGEDDGGGNVGHGGLVDENEKVRLKVERLPSSGPAPFFHAGYTAYFEITLGETVAPLEQPRDADFHLEQCVAIGLAHDNFPLEDKQPGWDRNSWGLHSDDGCFHHRGAIALPATADPTTFGAGDTVGCGLLYPRGLAHYEHWLSGRGGTLPTAGENDSGGNNGAVFFTKNGRYLGMASRRVNVKRPLYPCVGLDSHCCVTVNFGSKAFAFDIPAFEALFTGMAQGSAPPALERRCHTDDIKMVYSGRNGFTNPRLLCPHHLRLLPPVDEGQDDDLVPEPARRGVPKGAEVLASESELLRRSLTSVRLPQLHFSLLSDESDNTDNDGDDDWLMSDAWVEDELVEDEEEEDEDEEEDEEEEEEEEDEEEEEEEENG